LDELTLAWLDFAVGGRPSRFMRSEVDWDRYHRFVAHVASLESALRPTTAEVRARLEGWLPKRGEWVRELIQVYEDGLATSGDASDETR
jgi:hypothetical protein